MNGYYSLGLGAALFYKGEKEYLVKPEREIEEEKTILRNSSDEDILSSETIEMVIAAGNLDLLKYLIERGAYIREGGDYMLRLASSRGHINLVKFLVELGADITAVDNESIRSASVNGHIKVVRFLTRHGADITARNSYPLRVAILNNNLKLVKFLISWSSKVLEDSKEAIIKNILEGDLEALKDLLSYHINISQNDNEFLKLAISGGNFRIFFYLSQEKERDRKAIFSLIKEAKRIYSSQISLQKARGKVELDRLSLSLAALEKGEVEKQIRLERRIKAFSSALVSALAERKKGYTEAAKYLSSYILSIRPKDYDQAFIEACRRMYSPGYLKAAKYLMLQGANIKANDDEAFRHAAKNGDVSIIKFILSQVNVVTKVKDMNLVSTLDPMARRSYPEADAFFKLSEAKRKVKALKFYRSFCILELLKQ